MRKVIATLIVALAFGAAHTAFAQDREDQDKPRVVTPTTPPPTPAAQKEDREPAKPVSPPRMTNIQIEVTITDQIGAAQPTKKTVSLITSDGSVGRVRSRADAFGARGPMVVNLNVDAVPRVVSPTGDQVTLNLTIEYNPLKTTPEGGAPPDVAPTQLNQQLSIIMTSGKPMVVSQAADPVTDRKIVVEAKATILK